MSDDDEEPPPPQDEEEKLVEWKEETLEAALLSDSMVLPPMPAEHPLHTKNLKWEDWVDDMDKYGMVLNLDTAVGREVFCAVWTRLVQTLRDKAASVALKTLRNVFDEDKLKVGVLSVDEDIANAIRGTHKTISHPMVLRTLSSALTQAKPRPLALRKFMEERAVRGAAKAAGVTSLERDNWKEMKSSLETAFQGILSARESVTPAVIGQRLTAAILSECEQGEARGRWLEVSEKEKIAVVKRAMMKAAVHLDPLPSQQDQHTLSDVEKIDTLTAYISRVADTLAGKLNDVRRAFQALAGRELRRTLEEGMSVGQVETEVAYRLDILSSTIKETQYLSEDQATELKEHLDVSSALGKALVYSCFQDEPEICRWMAQNKGKQPYGELEGQGNVRVSKEMLTKWDEDAAKVATVNMVRSAGGAGSGGMVSRSSYDQLLHVTLKYREILSRQGLIDPEHPANQVEKILQGSYTSGAHKAGRRRRGGRRGRGRGRGGSGATRRYWEKNQGGSQSGN